MGRVARVPESLKRGPFTLEEAREAGLQRWHLEGASWTRLARGTYRWSGLRETAMVRIVAARKRVPDTAVFSGLTAAWIHGLEVLGCDPIEVSVAPSLPLYGRSGLRVRRLDLPAMDVVDVRGLRATSVVRTIADVCGRLPLVDAVVLADAALHSRRVLVEELFSWADKHRGAPGVRRLRRVLLVADAAAESPMESRLRMKLGIEFDGAVHGEWLAEDNRRQNRLLDAGVRLLRFAAADVLRKPVSVVAQVRAMFA